MDEELTVYTHVSHTAQVRRLTMVSQRHTKSSDVRQPRPSATVRAISRVMGPHA